MRLTKYESLCSLDLFHDEKDPLTDNHRCTTATYIIRNISRKYSQRYSVSKRVEARFCKIHAGRRDFCWNAKTWPMTAKSSDHQEIRQLCRHCPFPRTLSLSLSYFKKRRHWTMNEDRRLRHSSSGETRKTIHRLAIACITCV